MLADKENHKVTLTDRPNGHILVLGKSGSGKTYFLCRKIEEDLEAGKRVFIIDYSGSYTKSEMKRNSFACISQVEMWNPFEKALVWNLRGSNAEKVIADSLIDELGIQSYYQRMLIAELTDKFVRRQEEISICSIMKELEMIIKIKKNEDICKNAEHLLNRLYPYRNINISLVKTNSIAENFMKQIVVLELSQYSQCSRKFLMELCVRFLWEEARVGKGWADVLVFDEFQYMDLCEGSAVDSLLREGRKFGVSTYLSSQFLGHKGRDAREMLMQAGNIIFFHPAESEAREVARWIDFEEPDQWRGILNKLKIGQAVIKGSYYIDKRTKVCKKPIICSVQEVTE